MDEALFCESEEEMTKEKKKRITCKSYCNVWDDWDRDCEIYGENHPSPRMCEHFRRRHSGLFESDIYSEDCPLFKQK